MQITESDLIEFANNPINKIELGQCHTNAYKVFKNFQGEIHSGYATFKLNDKSPSTDPHFWNVLDVASGEGKSIRMLVDIYSYKASKIGSYIEHSGDEIDIEFFEQQVIESPYTRSPKT